MMVALCAPSEPPERSRGAQSVDRLQMCSLLGNKF